MEEGLEIELQDQFTNSTFSTAIISDRGIVTYALFTVKQEGVLLIANNRHRRQGILPRNSF